MLTINKHRKRNLNQKQRVNFRTVHTCMCVGYITLTRLKFTLRWSMTFPTVSFANSRHGKTGSPEAEIRKWDELTISTIERTTLIQKNHYVRPQPGTCFGNVFMHL